MRRFFVYTVAGAILLLGCGGDKATGPASIQGTYSLQTINGTTPPAIVVQVGTYKLEITAGSVSINANNTWSDTHTFRETDAGTVTTTSVTCTGTYTQNGTGLSLTEASTADCGGTFVGTLNGTTLTVSWDATIQGVYKK